MSTAQVADMGDGPVSAQGETLHPAGQHVAEGKEFWVRAGAYLVDGIVLFVVSTATSLIVGMFLAIVLALVGQDFAPNAQTPWWLNAIVGLALSTAYYTLFEGLYGASVGKLLLRMRVVQTDGRPCSLGSALVRALLRHVDGLFLGLVAASSMKPPLRQRLGDKAADTVVLDCRDPFIQQDRPWWWLVIAALLYLGIATMGLSALLILRLL